MNIIGNKVVLRTMTEQDKKMLLSLIEDPDVSKVTKGYPHPVSYRHQISWFRSSSEPEDGLHCIIANKENPQNGLGVIILSNVDLKEKTAEVYIKLMKSARQKGYGQDAVTTLVSYAFQKLGLNCIYASILEYNTASRKLFEKCGFREECMPKSREYEEEQGRNVCLYNIRINQHNNG